MNHNVTGRKFFKQKFQGPKARVSTAIGPIQKGYAGVLRKVKENELRFKQELELWKNKMATKSDVVQSSVNRAT